MSYNCVKCGSPYRIVRGKDNRRFYECSNPQCTFNYINISKPILGKNRRHFKLSKEDYVQIQQESSELTIGHLSKRWGVGRKQITRILKLNLSSYAERIYGEKPISLNRSNLT